MKLVGTTAAAASMGGVATATTQPHDGATLHGMQFGTVVNMVDAGADPTGKQPIDHILEANAKDNTLLYFPEGRYRLNQFRNYKGSNSHFDDSLYYGLKNFGLLGAGSGKSVLVPRDGQGSNAYGSGYFDKVWFELRHGKNYLVKGFTLDYTAKKTGGRFQLLAEGDYLVDDVRVKGVNDVRFGPLLFSVLTRGGRGVVRNVRLPDGGSPIEYGPVGIFVSRGHQGTLTFRNCVVKGFPNNGLYASNPSDPAAVRVIGGHYANNNISQVRLGTSRSFVKNALVEVTKPYTGLDYAKNMRGIRVADGSGVEIRNCDVVMSARFHSAGAIVGNRHAGGFTVKNTRIRVDSPYEFPAVHAKPTGVANSGVTLENVSITGDAAGRTAVSLQGRDRSTLKNVCIQQTGASRDGVTLKNTNATIENSTVNVTGRPVVTLGSSRVRTKHVRHSGTCPVPRTK